MVTAPSSGSPILTYSRVASQTMAIDTSRCIATVHHSRPVPHGDAADHRLQHRRGRHQPGVDEDFATAACPGNRQHRQHRGDYHREGDQAVPNSTTWWTTGISARGTA